MAIEGTVLNRPRNISISETKFIVEGKPRLASENINRKKLSIGITIANPR
jgi:hypothetical protein